MTNKLFEKISQECQRQKKKPKELMKSKGYSYVPWHEFSIGLRTPKPKTLAHILEALGFKINEKKLVRAMLKQKRTSVRKIATDSGISYTTFYKLLREEGAISLYIGCVIAKNLNLELENFIIQP